jgi:5-methylthioadenosine/S-adenosylhomocysteine deaminase
LSKLTPRPADLLIKEALLPSGEQADVTVEAGRIAVIGAPNRAVSDAAATIDASGMLLLPGLCNAHLHSMEMPLRGVVWGLPMELYRVCIAPLGMGTKISPEDVYARTRAAALEMLRNGTTMVVDDVVHESLEAEYVDAVLQAYADVGMRAMVTIHCEDRPWTESVPFLDDLVDAEAREWLTAVGTPSTESLLETCEAAVGRWSEHELVSCIPGPSAPHRCTPELLSGLKEISTGAGLAFHIHVQETLMQATGGPLMFGKSMVAWLDELGLLDRGTTIAHGVWLSEEDIEIVARTGTSVVHNPISNLKLGSGIAPVRRLLAAGVNVALGGDGYTCNDRQDMFEAIKLAALLSDVRSSDFEQWLAPEEVLEMATVNGARANLLDGLGLIEEGSPADLALVRLDPPEFHPLNDPLAQAVFAGDARHVDTVIVGGEVLVEGGRALRIDEQAAWAASAESATRFLEAAGPFLERMAGLMPAHREAYRRCVEILSRDPYWMDAAPVLSLDPSS